MFFLILWVENKNVLQAMAYAFEGEKYIRLSRKKDKRGKKKKDELWSTSAGFLLINVNSIYNSLSFYKWEVHTLESLYIPLVPILQSTQQVNDLIEGLEITDSRVNSETSSCLFLKND